MFHNKRIIAIIPARGGSKRLPGKNIKELAHKPLIAWTIDAALNSSILDTIMVNTDDQRIVAIAKKYRAEVPFLRENNLATDTASSLDVIEQTLLYYNSQNIDFDIVILLQPTSPLRNSDDIKNALNLFIDKKAASVLSVCEVEHPIQWSNTLDNSLSMDNFIKEEHRNTRSQDLEKNYRLNGAIYIWDCKEFLLKKESIITPAFSYIMPRERSIDIDEEIDFKLAELLLKI